MIHYYAKILEYIIDRFSRSRRFLSILKVTIMSDVSYSQEKKYRTIKINQLRRNPTNKGILIGTEVMLVNLVRSMNTKF